MDIKKSVLLVRVSTVSQDYTAQKNDLIEYSKQLGVEEYHIIEDKESAIKLSEEERNGLVAMKDWINEHPDYNSVIVWEISRLARTEKVLHSIKEYFLKNHIQLYIYDKKYKLLNDDYTENQETGLLFSLYSYFAASEMKVKKERFARGKALNSKLGKFNGGGIRFGYTTDENNYIVPDPKNAEIVKKMFLMYATGNYSVMQLSKELEMHNIHIPIGTISGLLSFKGYIGENKNRKYIPIIDKGLFEKVQKLKLTNNLAITKTKRYYFGNKILKCNGCNHSLVVAAKSYSCVNNRQFKTCDCNTNISREWFDILIWYVAMNKHKSYIQSDKETKVEDLFNDVKQLMLRTVVVQNQINQIKKKYERINHLYVNMKITDEQYEAMDKEISSEIKEKENQLHLYDVEIDNKQILMTQLSENKDITLNEDLTLKEMRDIVRLHIKEARLYKVTDRNAMCTRIVFEFKDGLYDEYYFYSKKQKKYEYKGELIDDLIYKTLGKTLKTIKDDLN